jgi:oligopeptide/dipeptide ABC transporter ATP-binding protein
VNTTSHHAVLEVDRLAIRIGGHRGSVMPLTDVSLSVAPGGALAVVGESGSGKSLTLKAILGLLPSDARIERGEIRFGDGHSPATAIDPATLRGRGIAFVPQEPMTAMNPTMRLGDLVASGARATRGLSRRAGRSLAVDLLAEVGMPDPRSRLDAWPHELSGGMRQRAMIAMALATEPTLLLCDEPTTALDVTVQDQIVRLLGRVRSDHGVSVLFVTHDLALAGQICEEVAVMYAGRVVETGPIVGVYERPAHQYTAALLAAVPDTARTDRGLTPIPGRPPDAADFIDGCRFAARCLEATDSCVESQHRLAQISPGRWTACIHPPSQ